MLSQSLEMLVYTIHKFKVDLTYLDMYIKTSNFILGAPCKFIIVWV